LLVEAHADMRELYVDYLEGTGFAVSTLLELRDNTVRLDAYALSADLPSLPDGSGDARSVQESDGPTPADVAE
jgi:hypothetical protein